MEKQYPTFEETDGQNLNMVAEAREGLAYARFQSILENSPFNTQDWAEYLHISERTMQRYKKQHAKFDQIYSERILHIADLIRIGTLVFGDRENFFSWLGTKNVALGGTAPKELLDTVFGIQMVRDELGRIEYGVFA